MKENYQKNDNNGTNINVISSVLTIVLVYKLYRQALDLLNINSVVVYLGQKDNSILEFNAVKKQETILSNYTKYTIDTALLSVLLDPRITT